MQRTRSATTIGVTCAALASTAFTLNDVGIKFLSGDYPLHQIVFVRTLVALSLTVGLIIPLEGGFSLLKTQHLKMHLLRGLAHLRDLSHLLRAPTRRGRHLRSPSCHRAARRRGRHRRRH